MFMVLVYPKEQLPVPTEMGWVAQAQVQLVLTGITDDLSAPICLDEIQEYAIGDSYTSGSQTITATLDIATRFIMCLEQREVEESDGSLDALSPNSAEWVNQTLFPKWLGNGASQTLWFTMWRLKVLGQDPRNLGKDWWWDHEEPLTDPRYWMRGSQ
ncbi:hypothetical protein F4678DRAFT_483885 [Xylaria arbuscula]|nr:hypothetical protein F4678DRAFT_483885 [Xylaria arbuscula]